MKDRWKKVKDKLRELLPMSWKDWGIFFTAMFVACLLCLLLQRVAHTDVYVPLIFVLVTLIVSLCTEGYAYGFLSAVTSVFAVNWAFTYPYLKLDFSIYGYPLTFLTMLAVGFAVSTLTARLKAQERIRMESEKEKMRANLLRAVSHDLRTPLTSISGSIGAVLDDNGAFTEEQRRELLQDAKNDAEWMCRMVENLLSITRIGDDRNNTIKKNPEMLEEVISESVVNFKKRHANVDVAVSVPDTLFFVEMDAMLIEQVLLNLMDNAVRPGGTTGKITINASVNESFATVSVSDDGKGFDKRIIEQIFEGKSKFFGLSDKDDNRFMGIGLSVCKTIINAHGGKIYAENGETGGAVFTFTLPIGGRGVYDC